MRGIGGLNSSLSSYIQYSTVVIVEVILANAASSIIDILYIHMIIAHNNSETK